LNDVEKFARVLQQLGNTARIGAAPVQFARLRVLSADTRKSTKQKT
jgi:hypothetical protein